MDRAKPAELLTSNDINSHHSDDDSSEDQHNGNDRELATKAFMPIAKYARFYKMDHERRGVAWIFNHEKFKKKTLEKRHGTAEDEAKLTKCLKDLHFEVIPFRDLKLKEVKEKIQQASETNYHNCDCLILIVLTHGEPGLLHAQDEPYDPEPVILDQFTADKCPTLAGKPKIFIFQACQGKNLDAGITLDNDLMRLTEFDSGNPHKRKRQGVTRYTIPVRADFLIVYSTARGHYAFRNEGDGSYFISQLCEQLENRAANEELLHILTAVNHHVAVDFQSFNDDNVAVSHMKQMPYFQSYLTRLLYFGQITAPPENPMKSTMSLIKSNKK